MKPPGNVRGPLAVVIDPLAWDTETDDFGLGKLAPKLICATFAERERADRAVMKTSLVSNADAGFKHLPGFLVKGKRHKVLLNAPYDLCVLVNAFPQYMSDVWTALDQGLIHDIGVREKLLNLGTHGKLTDYEIAPGVNKHISYSMQALAMSYLGQDLTEVKTSPDAWRKHFNVLDGMKSELYPPDAADYAMKDASITLQIYEHQDARAIRETGSLEIFRTEPFHTAVAFALRLITCWGVRIDHKEKARIAAIIEKELAPEKHQKLIACGVLVPAKPPRPYANGTVWKDGPLVGQVKMTVGEDEHISKLTLQAVIKEVCSTHGIVLKRGFGITDPTDSFPNGQISTATEFLDEIKDLGWEEGKPHTILQEYSHRQSLQKIVNTELPRMSAEIIHANFNVLVETGRTSSSASDDYPSFNGQNVAGAIAVKDEHGKLVEMVDVRGCFIPREGNVFYSADFSAMELVTLAQKCYSLFGHSVLRDIINAGIDAHAYFGAQIAYNLDDEFRNECAKLGIAGLKPIYEFFAGMENNKNTRNTKHDGRPQTWTQFYKHWRNFAKPFNLGLPGGLGVDTFIKFAKGTYGVTVNPEQARFLKSLWLSTFPELVEYFHWVNTVCPDGVKHDGDTAYSYVSPLGMRRAGASYCATANGAALQTPGGEGAKSATFHVVRACYDQAMKSCLYGTHVWDMVHDELLGEIPEDRWMHERCQEVTRLMVAAFQDVQSDVKIKAGICLMRRWTKDAKPVYVNERLQVWEPENKKGAAA